MNEETVRIEWKEFGESFAADLWQFFNSDEYSDVTISSEDGQQIKSHRILLAMCSAYFRELFKRNKSPGHIICLSNIRSDILLKIFGLIYGGCMQIDPKSLADFITAAKFLKLNGFNDIDPNIDIDEISMVNKQTPKKSFLLKLKRCDPAPTQDQQTNNNGGNSTSTMNEENGKFLPSSESDESDDGTIE